MSKLLVLAGLILTCPFGCTSTEVHEKEYWEIYNCPQVVWKYWPTAMPDSQQDWLNEQGARRGCIRHYGEGACLVSMTKTGKDSYYAMCRRFVK